MPTTTFTTKSPGAGIAFRTPLPKQFRQIASRSIKAGDHLTQVSNDQANSGMLNQFGDKFRSTGIDASLENEQEIKVLEQFLEGHVQANKICDVQCMMLWSEWVRTFQRHTSKYPTQILEKEFRNVITDNYGIKVANYSARGAVFSGIKFVP